MFKVTAICPRCSARVKEHSFLHMLRKGVSDPNYLCTGCGAKLRRVSTRSIALQIIGVFGAILVLAIVFTVALTCAGLLVRLWLGGPETEAESESSALVIALISFFLSFFFLVLLGDLVFPFATQFENIETTCTKCGYDLRGTPSNECPECGTVHKP